MSSDEVPPAGSAQVAIIRDPRINESSGIAISRENPGDLWLHNDSGDDANLFLVRRNGTTRAVVQLESVRPFDWEDMCSFRADGTSWLLIADVGDNAIKRGTGDRSGGKTSCRLLLVKERRFPAAASRDEGHPELTATWPVHAEMEFSFSDGPRNCESVAVDTTKNEILLISKSQPLDCGLYRISLQLESGKFAATAELLTKLSIPFATGMDISTDGRRMVVVSPFGGIVVDREETETWEDACRRSPVVVELPRRRQGETVCFELDGQTVLTNSEFTSQPLWRTRLPVPIPAPEGR